MAKKKEKLSPEARRRALTRLLKYCKPLIPIAAGAFILAGVSIVAAHFIPVLVGDAIDLAVGAGNVDMAGILKILTLIPLLALLSAVFDWLVRLAGLRLGAAVTSGFATAIRPPASATPQYTREFTNLVEGLVIEE